VARLRYSEHAVGNGPAFRQQACRPGLEGAISEAVRISARCCSATTPMTGRRTGTGRNMAEPKRLAGVLSPLQVPRMLLAKSPPRDSRFRSLLPLSRVHWVRPEVVVEVTYLTWTEDNLLRQVSYEGQREDKAARQVVRPIPPPATTFAEIGFL
jgi:ATP-dependent DNA ligase